MDKKKLFERIKACGYSRQEFCKKIGMSRTAFYRKCEGITDFTLSEIKSIIKALDLKKPNDIFFSDRVS